MSLSDPSPQPSGPVGPSGGRSASGRSRKGERGFGANPYRGEANINVGGEVLVLRPSFTALVAAEQELGSLFELVERASQGRLRLDEIAALFDHVSAGRTKAITRERIGDAIVEKGLADVTPILRVLLGQILQGK